MEREKLLTNRMRKTWWLCFFCCIPVATVIPGRIARLSGSAPACLVGDCTQALCIFISMHMVWQPEYPKEVWIRAAYFFSFSYYWHELIYVLLQWAQGELLDSVNEAPLTLFSSYNACECTIFQGIYKELGSKRHAFLAPVLMSCFFPMPMLGAFCLCLSSGMNQVETRDLMGRFILLSAAPWVFLSLWRGSPLLAVARLVLIASPTVLVMGSKAMRLRTAMEKGNGDLLQSQAIERSLHRGQVMPADAENINHTSADWQQWLVNNVENADALLVQRFMASCFLLIGVVVAFYSTNDGLDYYTSVLQGRLVNGQGATDYYLLPRRFWDFISFGASTMVEWGGDRLMLALMSADDQERLSLTPVSARILYKYPLLLQGVKLLLMRGLLLVAGVLCCIWIPRVQSLQQLPGGTIVGKPTKSMTRWFWESGCITVSFVLGSNVIKLNQLELEYSWDMEGGTVADTHVDNDAKALKVLLVILGAPSVDSFAEPTRISDIVTHELCRSSYVLVMDTAYWMLLNLSTRGLGILQGLWFILLMLDRLLHPLHCVCAPDLIHTVLVEVMWMLLPLLHTKTVCQYKCGTDDNFGSDMSMPTFLTNIRTVTGHMARYPSKLSFETFVKLVRYLSPVTVAVVPEDKKGSGQLLTCPLRAKVQRVVGPMIAVIGRCCQKSRTAKKSRVPRRACTQMGAAVDAGDCGVLCCPSRVYAMLWWTYYNDVAMLCGSSILGVCRRASHALMQPITGSAFKEVSGTDAVRGHSAADDTSVGAPDLDTGSGSRQDNGTRSSRIARQGASQLQSSSSRRSEGRNVAAEGGSRAGSSGAAATADTPDGSRSGVSGARDGEEAAIGHRGMSAQAAAAALQSWIRRRAGGLSHVWGVQRRKENQSSGAAGANEGARRGEGSGGGGDTPSLCVVCMDVPREVAMLPCGHYVACRTCCIRLMEAKGPCPICRTAIMQITTIYFG